MITNIAIFIGLFLVYLVMVAILAVIRYKEENLLAASILDIGFMFLKPFILMWYIQFIFGIVIGYWPLMGGIFVLQLFTTRLTRDDIDRLD